MSNDQQQAGTGEGQPQKSVDPLFAAIEGHITAYLDQRLGGIKDEIAQHVLAQISGNSGNIIEEVRAMIEPLGASHNLLEERLKALEEGLSQPQPAPGDPASQPGAATTVSGDAPHPLDLAAEMAKLRQDLNLLKGKVHSFVG